MDDDNLGRRERLARLADRLRLARWLVLPDLLRLGRFVTLPIRVKLRLADDWDPLSLGLGRRPSLAPALDSTELTDLTEPANECRDDELADRTDNRLPLGATSCLLALCDRLEVRLLMRDLTDSGLPLPERSSCSTSSAIAAISSNACPSRSTSL